MMRPMVEVESSSEVLEDDPWGPPTYPPSSTWPEGEAQEEW